MGEDPHASLDSCALDAVTTECAGNNEPMGRFLTHRAGLNNAAEKQELKFQPTAA